MSTSNTDIVTIGQSEQGRDIKALMVGELDPDKPTILVIGQQHPHETPGVLALQTFAREILTGSSQTAIDYRRRFTTIIVPQVNPDGAEIGNWRDNALDSNLNEDWNASKSWIMMVILLAIG